MKSRDCRATRQEIDELEFGSQPSQLATTHLAACEACRQFRDERAELRELVGSLERVGAPPDFDMRLRARIAAERSNNRQQSIFGRLLSTPALVAAALFVIVAGSVLWIAQKQTPSTVGTPNLVATNNANTGAGSATQLNPTPATVDTARTPSSGTDVIAQAGGNPVHKNRGLSRSGRSQDFASLPATSIRQSDADQAYVNAPSKPVVFSLEDERGATRKISLPPVTFGAQNLVDNRMQASYSGNSRVW